MKTIPELEKEFVAEINKYFKIDYSIYGGTFRGNKKVMGKHMCLQYSARMVLAEEYVRELGRIVEKYYGAIAKITHSPDDVFVVSQPGAEEFRQITFEFVDQSE
jgi:hypothetical protein